MVALAASSWACRNDMHDQPRYEPLEPSTFYADGMGSRRPVEGTVAVGSLDESGVLATGRAVGSNEPVAAPPTPVDAALLARGRERYDIYCAPCHDRTGSGRGIVVQRGMKQPPSFHSERLVRQPIGHVYDVITNGFGAMYPYRTMVPVEDRWAIAAYVKTLQRAYGATLDDVPPDLRGQLEALPAQPEPPPGPPGGRTPERGTVPTPPADAAPAAPPRPEPRPSEGGTP